MQIGDYKFDRFEFAGSLGDLGTLIPLAVALMVITGLNVTSVLLLVGLFYIASGIYFKLPIPVQPLKVVAAIAIAYPEKITIATIMAAGIIIGVILLLLALTGLIDWMASFFSKPIVRGIQLGLGLILIAKGIEFIRQPELFINNANILNLVSGVPLNLIIGIISVIVVLMLISNRRYPAALVIVTAGIIIGVCFGALKDVRLVLGPLPLTVVKPNIHDFLNGFILLVIPQLPLTIGNAIIGTADTCKNLFRKKDELKRITHKDLSVSMGLINIITGMIGGMPLCHGAGGLAAHYRFGARTGGSNIMIGSIFLLIALVFGRIGISLLSSIPQAILGTLLLFAGLELAMLILDVKEKRDLFIALLIAGISLVTTNMAIAFLIGIIVYYLIKWKDIHI
jgi:SulP family sulfate permease